MINVNLNWIVDQMSGYVKYKHNINFKKLNGPLSYDGGKDLIDRLINLFELRSRVELGDLLGVTPGTISTWTTRNTTPHELLIRIHLLTGWPMQYLCFGTGTPKGEDQLQHTFESSNKVIDIQSEQKSRNILDVFLIKNGQLEKTETFEVTPNVINHFKVKGNNGDLAISERGNLLFISTEENKISIGKYLFSVNESYQVGELRLFPDGKTYLLENSERYEIDTSITTVHGKVVSILESV